MDDRFGSLGDFIDSTIMRCLLDFEQTSKENGGGARRCSTSLADGSAPSSSGPVPASSNGLGACWEKTHSIGSDSSVTNHFTSGRDLSIEKHSVADILNSSPRSVSASQAAESQQESFPAINASRSKETCGATLLKRCVHSPEPASSRSSLSWGSNSKGIDAVALSEPVPSTSARNSDFGNLHYVHKEAATLSSFVASSCTDNSVSRRPSSDNLIRRMLRGQDFTSMEYEKRSSSILGNRNDCSSSTSSAANSECDNGSSSLGSVRTVDSDDCSGTAKLQGVRSKPCNSEEQNTSIQTAVLDCHGSASASATSAGNTNEEGKALMEASTRSSELTVSQKDDISVRPAQFAQSTQQPADRKSLKKKMKERYFNDPQPEEQSTVTFNVEESRVSNYRIQKWKKRRFQKAEDDDKSPSKPKIPKHKQNKKPKTTAGQGSSFLEEQPGHLIFESDEEFDSRFPQEEIAAAVDVTSASKYFELNLKDFGPYGIHYTRNGRHLLLGGKRGHTAAFDWQTKKLHCEFNVMETVNCVRWLHQETMFAAAQRSGVCIYDNQGIELHALQNLDSVLRMEFLPYHMLLATANSKGFLGYTDTSTGHRVASICTGLGQLDTMTHNPANAVVHMGHASGVVTLWAPTVKEPLQKILCHKAAVKSITIDSSGNYMATSGVDKRLKIFDLRKNSLLSATHIPIGASSLAFSQRGLLAASLGSKVQVYRDCFQSGQLSPFLSHMCGGNVKEVQFCPFEDVLGVGHSMGFSSLIIPGSGEPNFDALVANPMATKKQRQHAEVRLLLDKLQPEMIGLTNWVTELGRKKQGSQSRPEPSNKKLGKKQKEMEQRELARQTAKAKPQKSAVDSHTDPLARFKKAPV